MKKVRKSNPARTLQHIVFTFMCLIIPLSALFASEVTAKEGDSNPLESSKTPPFEYSITETNIVLENWMTIPFEAADHIELESWMTTPFEAADYIELESWMTTPF